LQGRSKRREFITGLPQHLGEMHTRPPLEYCLQQMGDQATQASYRQWKRSVQLVIIRVKGAKDRL